MKTYFATVITTLTLLSACTTETDKKNEDLANKKYTNKIDSLNSAINSKDSSVNYFLSSFNEIEQTLDSVSLKQHLISINVDKNGSELKANVKNKINAQIVAINDLIEKNKKKIGDLNRKLKKNSLQINEFQKMVDNLNEQIVQKNAELTSLNEKLNSADTQIAQLKTSLDTLTNANVSQSKVIATQTSSIHTAYYAIGKAKDLETKKIIDKKGGLLGLGKTPKLNSDLNKNDFETIDYTKVMNIPINSKKAKIVTAHPSDSYTLEKNDGNGEYTNLKITQPEKFWSESKYLVVIN
jgi:chromosome segregation ATPase